MRFSSIILAFFIALSPISFTKIFFHEVPNAEAADRTISEYEEWTTDQEIDGYILVESGATLVIKKGVTVTFKSGSRIDVEGRLISKGTQNSPVKFKKEGIDELPEEEIYEYEGYFIYIYGGEVYLKNTDISGGGNVAPYEAKNNSILNTAYAYGEEGIIYVFGNMAKLTMNGCNIHGNVAGVYLDGAKGENIKVNRTLFNRNIYFDERDHNLQGSAMPNFKYNWWRNPDGPEKREIAMFHTNISAKG